MRARKSFLFVLESGHPESLAFLNLLRRQRFKKLFLITHEK